MFEKLLDIQALHAAVNLSYFVAHRTSSNVFPNLAFKANSIFISLDAMKRRF